MKCEKCKHAENCPAKTEHGGAIRCSAFKPQEMTNEGWLKQCDTEQLAEFLADKCNEVVDTVLLDASCDIYDIDNDDYWYRQADFVEWLKQPHNDS